VGKVDAAICRLPLSHDGLVQCTVLLEEKKKLVGPAGHRLSDRELIDPEETGARDLADTTRQSSIGGRGAAIHFPDHTPSGRPIAARAIRNNDPRMSCGRRIRRRPSSSWVRERNTTIPTPASDLSRSAFLPWQPRSSGVGRIGGV